MKTALAAHAAARALGVTLTLGAITLINTCIPVPVPAAESPKESSAGFTEQLRKWQGKMSDAFRDTFKSLRADSSGTELKGAVSVNFREQNDSYTLRLSLPDRDLNKVEVSFKDNTLHVVAPEDGKSRRYEQSIAMSDVAPGAKPQIDRKQEDNLMLITIPKASSPKTAVKEPAPGVTHPDALTKRDHDTMDQMGRLQREMDHIFENAFKPFSIMPDFKGFFDEPRFGSSYTVEDSGSSYVIRAYLPERNMNNVIATIEGQTLTIEAKAENVEGRSKDNHNGESRMAHYTQMITLPGPVKASKMSVDNKEGMVVITLPKAEK